MTSEAPYGRLRSERRGVVNHVGALVRTRHMSVAVIMGANRGLGYALFLPKEK